VCGEADSVDIKASSENGCKSAAGECEMLPEKVGVMRMSAIGVVMMAAAMDAKTSVVDGFIMIDCSICCVLESMHKVISRVPFCSLCNAVYV
jgi:hypothetical protein